MDLWLSESCFNMETRANLRCWQIRKKQKAPRYHIVSGAKPRPEGMVASAIEFGEICRKHDFHNFIFSPSLGAEKAATFVIVLSIFESLRHEVFKSTSHGKGPLFFDNLLVTSPVVAGECVPAAGARDVQARLGPVGRVVVLSSSAPALRCSCSAICSHLCQSGLPLAPGRHRSRWWF